MLDIQIQAITSGAISMSYQQHGAPIPERLQGQGMNLTREQLLTIFVRTDETTKHTRKTTNKRYRDINQQCEGSAPLPP